MKPSSKNINYSFLTIIIIIVIKILFLSSIYLLSYENLSKAPQRDNIQSNIFTISNSLVYFKLIDIKYLYSFKFNIIKVEYYIKFFENNNTFILPSDLVLYKNLHIFCHFESNNSNFIINSFPEINQNKYFKCIEFFNTFENINFGIKIYKINENFEKINNYIINLFSRDLSKFMNLFYKYDSLFDALTINRNYLFNFSNKYFEDSFKLQKSYSQMPKCFLKRNLIINDDEWNFDNFFNEYFCFCKDLNSSKLNYSQKCKYYFYLNLIDKNRKVYQKTDFLFIDFILSDLTSDDAYPIFKEMSKENFPVHYITENSNIYNEYCSEIDKCLKVIQVNKQNYTINGDFLEKYLTLILKLKQVISNSGIYFSYINNIFFNIEYITYISITHGVCYFKYYLYDEYKSYGTKKYDKILIPPTEKILFFAKKYGWNNKDIIQLNLPKWDKYNIKNNSINMMHKNNSILIMFTWREVTKNEQISPNYFKNIFNLISNKKLNKNLKSNNIKLYFTFHHKIDLNYKFKIKSVKYIKFFEQNKIAEYIQMCDLFITDFSSIIFDFIYRRKPFIIFIPDCNDTLINKIYDKNYFEIIQSMKNGTIKFENKYFDIDSAINKIIFYVKNNFQLDKKLRILYDSLNIKKKNNTHEFIKYITNIN